MSEQMQQGNPQPKRTENPAEAAPAFRVVVDNDAMDVKKAAVARDVNAAKHPVIVIAEKQAAFYGQQAETLHRAFRNCAFVFETAQAEKTFYEQDQSMAYYIHHQTIGILNKTNGGGDEDHSPVFLESDHIVILGDTYSFHEDSFKEMATKGKKVTFSNNSETPVDLGVIAKMRNEPRDFRTFAFRYRIGMPE